MKKGQTEAMQEYRRITGEYPTNAYTCIGVIKRRYGLNFEEIRGILQAVKTPRVFYKRPQVFKIFKDREIKKPNTETVHPDIRAALDMCK